MSKQILKSTIPTPPPPPPPPPLLSFELSLKIVDFDLVAIFGKGWKWCGEINGPEGDDGVTRFPEALVEACRLHYAGKTERAKNLLLPTGIREGKTSINGEDRIRALKRWFQADPRLLWSLWKEEGWKTLEFLFQVFGVEWLEALRRVFCTPRGGRRSLCLCRSDHRSWTWMARWFDGELDASKPALCLGKKISS